MRRLAAALTLVLAAAGATAYAAPSLSTAPLSGAGASLVEAQRDHLSKQIRPPLRSAGIPTERTGPAPCVKGTAAGFPCDGVDLLSFVPLTEFAGLVPQETAPIGGGTSDLWGWTDSETGDEYVLIGKTTGTAFFRVTDPTAPVYLGELPNSSPGQLIWHDMKVYEDHAFIVSESVGHGMRVFDLTRLRDVTTPQTFLEDATYPIGFSVHNIAINEETGFAYLVGGNNGIVVPDQCQSGLHMVDITTPTLPVFAGCYLQGESGAPARSSYVHDTQCVVYRGPDAEHHKKELCFNAGEDHFSVVDVTDKLNPVALSNTPYEDVQYAHQGWLTDDQSTFLLGDELDETDGEQRRTRTLVFDVTDLDAPVVEPAFQGRTAAIDHNMYVRDGLVYQSNYAAGLAVLGTRMNTDSGLKEVAFFDSFPEHDRPEYVGTWSNYPYFASGTVAVSGIDDGLFLLKVQDKVLKKHSTAER